LGDSEFNFELCQERHENIDEDMKEMKKGLKSVNNRFLIFLTMLALTLVGVAANLIIVVMRAQ